jgi:hypothetical protein
MSTSRVLRTSLTVCALAILPLSTSFAIDDAPVPRAEIPFANHGGIRDWAADRDKGLWVQGLNKQWLYATFMGPCNGLDFANSIAFDTRPMGTFDRWSSVIVPGRQRCVIAKLTPSDGPVAKHKASEVKEESPKTAV